MARYFLDTSALVKRYVTEKGRTWIASLCRPSRGHGIYISQAAMIHHCVGWYGRIHLASQMQIVIG